MANPHATENRSRLIDCINASPAGGLLRREIDYVIETWQDDPDCGDECDAVDAFHHVMSLAHSEGDRPLARACIDILIEVGYYRPRESAPVTIGADRAPVRNGVRYDCVDAWCVWFGGGHEPDADR